MFAPRHHPAMRYVVPVRKALGVHTVFNILGPLTNPAGAGRQLIGVADASRVELLAETLVELGIERAWVLRSGDGLDELSIVETSRVIEVRDGRLRRFKINPEEAGIKRATSLAGTEGGTPSVNAARVRSVLSGEQGPARDIVVLNAAATLVVADLADDIGSGADLAREAIDSGKAAGVLENLVNLTTGAATA